MPAQKEIKKQITALSRAFNPDTATKAEWFAFEDNLRPLLDQLLYANPGDKAAVEATTKPAGICVGADSNEQYGRYETDTLSAAVSGGRRWVSPLTEHYAYAVKRQQPASPMEQEQQSRYMQSLRCDGGYECGPRSKGFE